MYGEKGGICFLFLHVYFVFYFVFQHGISTMDPVIVRIHCERWESTPDILDNLDAVIDDDESEKIWDVYLNKQNCIFAVEASTTDQLRQEFQGFKQLWPSPSQNMTKQEIQDCLQAAAVIIANRPKTKIRQCFLDMASSYSFREDLERLLQHDREQQIYLLQSSIGYLKHVIDLLNSSLTSEWVLSNFERRIKDVQSFVLKITEQCWEWEQDNPRRLQKGVKLMS